jgi:3'(2'), 5'-bisphosphate nucleotidase
MQDDRALLELAARLARQAAAAILAVRDAGFAVDVKRDRTPVTEADRIAEALIVEGLRAATPDIPVVAEEEVEAGVATAAGECFWLVDPLDGTRDFAAGGPGYAVNIGLVRGGVACLGAVALPETGEVFGGVLGLGAWKEGGGEPARRPIAVRRVPRPEGLVVMAGSHAPGEAGPLERFLAGRQVAGIIRIGGAQKMLRVAEGVADVFPRFARTREWDTAAPQAVLEAAGGSVTLWDSGGAPLRYGKPDWRNPGFLAVGGVAP